MRQYNPKPLRPADPNPLFKFCNDYEIEPELTPIQRQRRADGTQHTRTGTTRLNPGNVEPVTGPELVLEKSSSSSKKLDPDSVVKSYLAKDGEEEEKSIAESTGKQVAGAMGRLVSPALGMAGRNR